MGIVSDISSAVVGGAFSAEDLTREALHRAESLNPQLNAFISLAPEAALARAREIDARRARKQPLGPLAGVPVAIKDNLCTTFGATTCASKILGNFRSLYDAHVVSRLLDADAVIIGKTNLDEFAMGSSTENSAFGVTLNPWDTTRVAGGTSGGSTAAVAAGIVPVALGSDTGGSVRQPAAFCSVVGLKPSYGRVSRFGLIAHGSSLDQIGPIARDAADAALLLSVIAGRDPHDSTSVDRPVPDYGTLLGEPLRGLRIGISDEYFGEGLDPQVDSAVRAAMKCLETLGATTVRVQLPHTRYAIACYYIVSTAEASSNLARFDGVRYGRRTEKPADVIDLYAASRGEGFGAEVKRRIMLGTYVLSSGYYDAYYMKALKVRTLIKGDYEQAFSQADVIVSPTSPFPPFRVGEKSLDPLAMYLSDIYTISANLAGIPALSLPCGHDSAGLPIGMQLMGPWLAEDRLLRVAHQYQQHTEHHTRRPPLCAGGWPL